MKICGFCGGKGHGKSKHQKCGFCKGKGVIYKSQPKTEADPKKDEAK